jgi:outer membrane immunogenic protein
MNGRTVSRTGQKQGNKMKSLSLAAALLLAGATAVSATDLAYRNTTGGVKDAAGTVVSWEGAYVGAHAGIANFGDSDSSGDGAIGGIHGGYDIQRGAVVFGPYASVNWSNAEIKTPDGVVEKGIDWSVGGRAGVEFGRVLAYGKVGFVQTEYSIRGTETMRGVEFGPGIEFNVAPGLFLGAEYLHREVGSNDVTEDLGLVTVKFKPSR